MYVPEELKLNKFRHVEIPAPHRVFARSGYVVSNPASYSQDELAVLSESKLDSIASMAREALAADRQLARDEAAAAEAQLKQESKVDDMPENFETSNSD